MTSYAPGWAWLINHGGKVGFGGVSVTPTSPYDEHPWLCGAKRAHVLVAGTWTLKPELAIDVDHFKGYRIDQLMTMGPESRTVEDLVAQGGRLLDIS